MGIFFKPDMTTAVEVPNVEAVWLLQRQMRATVLMRSVSEERELRRGDIDEPRLMPADIRSLRVTPYQDTDWPDPDPPALHSRAD